jgi:hypothetical protein
MEQILEKVKNALPVLEAKIKELTVADIKLDAHIGEARDGNERIVISSGDLKNQVMSGIAAPIFKEIHFDTWEEALMKSVQKCVFFQK